MNEIELLSPAGSFDTALAAFAAGADAVYLGLNSFSARAEAVNLTEEELRLLLAHARTFPSRKRIYVTFNTLIDDAQLPDALEKLAILEELQVDGLIVQDLGIARLVRRHFPGLPLHASTQLVAHNLEGVLALKELGFTRVVLSRELSLEDIRSIARRCGVEIEVFVHGALCYSISGLCLFSAMEKNRSGNRGKCAYCCRLGYADQNGTKSLPFSMKDLRLDHHLDALREAGVASLKIEGRMKSSLYVSTVTAYYRNLLNRVAAYPQKPTVPPITRADLETVFSRRTTSLYIDGYSNNCGKLSSSPIDSESLGHLGTPIGTIKRLTKDREGRTWLRFHTSRALEKHDGLQFAAPEGGKPLGFGITEMRTAISRRNVFEVQAGEDVEVLLPPETPLNAGMTVYCSASNAVKRRYPVPSFRPSDVSAGTPVDVKVTLSETSLSASATLSHSKIASSQMGTDPNQMGTGPVTITAQLTQAQHPERTFSAVEKAFSRMGTSDWRLGRLELNDPHRLFAPASILNDLRRELVENLDYLRITHRKAKIAAALFDLGDRPLTNGDRPQMNGDRPQGDRPCRVLKLRMGQQPLSGNWDELVVAIGHSGEVPEYDGEVRLALPIFTLEHDFGRLRARVKNLLRCGYRKWEASDLATLRLLKQCGAEDITADWSLYAFNRSAILQLAELGISRFVCSPENSLGNLVDISKFCTEISNIIPEFICRQTTPLFISLTRPAGDDPSRLTGTKGDEFKVQLLDDLWITSRTSPHRYDVPTGNCQRTDICWD